MTVFNPNPDKPVNNNGGSQGANYAKVEASRDTEFGTVDPKNNQLIQYNLLVESTDKDSNNTTNVRTTLSEYAVRQDKFDFYSGKFDPNFPSSDVYSFCNPELSIVFQNGAYQYTRKVKNDSGYPLDVTIQKVRDSVQENQYGDNYSGNCAGGGGVCPGNVPPDPITGLCVPPEKCIPDPVEPCPEPELVNLKPTIYGYAFYLDKIRSVNVPNIGQRLVRCAGGHRCNRTHFKPRLKLSDNSIIDASNNISLDNLNFPGYTPPVPQYFPVSGFVGATAGERSDSFTLNVGNPSLLDNTCEIFLECLSPNSNCHTSVTMIFLVGQRSDNDEYVLIFADCLAPGSVNAEFLGSVPCNDDPPEDCCYYGGLSDCSPTPPPTTPTPTISCSYLEKTSASITFSNINIPFESMGDQNLIDQIEALIYNGPHIISFNNVDANGISSSPYLIGTVSGSIQVLAYFNATTDGLGNLVVSVALNILQTASAYPYVYGINFISIVPDNDLCDYAKDNGQVAGGDGISAPSYTGDGNESVSVDLI